jgi:HAD superfamily hydrolase (TIGR01509 family)
MSPPRSVCFDLDSTLCLSTQSDHEIHEEVFDRVGIEPLFSPGDVRAVDTTTLDAAESDTEFYTNLYRAAVQQSTERGIEPSLLADLAEITTDVVDETAVRFREGAESALQYAREQYDEVGLITNGGEQTQTAKLETLGIDGDFDVTVFCDPSEGIRPKPATEPFELALSELNATPEQTVYIGDTHSSDVVGAHRAGLQSVWAPVDRPHEQTVADPEPVPTYRLDSIGDLPTVL